MQRFREEGLRAIYMKEKQRKKKEAKGLLEYAKNPKKGERRSLLRILYVEKNRGIAPDMKSKDFMSLCNTPLLLLGYCFFFSNNQFTVKAETVSSFV